MHTTTHPAIDSHDDALSGRVVLVTGAASGIGRAVATLLAERRCRLALTDIAGDALGILTDELTAVGAAVSSVTANVATGAGASEAVQAAIDAFGGLDALVNVVGVSNGGKTVVELTEEQWAEDLRLNLTSMFLMCRMAIPHLRKRGEGSIVNVSSAAGVRGAMRNPGYCAAKAGVIGLTKALAIDHSNEGIRVNAIAPGAVLTPLMERNRTPEQIAHLARATLVGHIADPREIATVVAFLAGSDSSFITGQVVEADGGVGGRV